MQTTPTDPAPLAETKPAALHDPSTNARRLQEAGMSCNCDLDRWEPNRNTGHSSVCRIHKFATNSALMGDIAPVLAAAALAKASAH